MLTHETVLQIFDIHDQLMDGHQYGHRFRNRYNQTRYQLPWMYREFVKSEYRWLSCNWTLYGYYGHDRLVTLEEKNTESYEDGLDTRYLIFGNVADDDLMLFDLSSPGGDTVIWVDTRRPYQVDRYKPFASSFAHMLLILAAAELDGMPVNTKSVNARAVIRSLADRNGLSLDIVR